MKASPISIQSEVESHLDILLLEPTLLVERSQFSRAVEDDLVAASRLRVVCEVADHPLAKVAAAGGGVDDDVFDMAHLPGAAEELALHEDASRSNDTAGDTVLGDNDEVVITEGC